MIQENGRVGFSTESRVHVGLEVRNLQKSLEFYRVLLAEEPTKIRSGYAKFEPSEPSMNLSLVESSVDSAPPVTGAMHHGIQVKTNEALRAMTARLQGAGLPLRFEEETTCCYAVQNKIWATDPDGNPWEVFVVLDEAEELANSSTACCAQDCC